ncbi:MAG: reverse transcriptase domain-containing protein [Cyanobacteriota bacterium]
MLSNVSYVPDLMVNLFSLTAVMERGFQVDGNMKGINIRKDDWNMRFDKRIGTPKGYVFAVTMFPESNEEDFANVTIQYENAHALLGHPGKNKLVGTSERLNWSLSKQTTNACGECLVAKAQRMKLNKESSNQSLLPGERLMIDTSSVKNKTKNRLGKYWLLVVNEATGMKWSFFLKNKDAQVPLLTGFIKTLQTQNKKVKFIRCDNAGENISLQKALDAEGMNIKFEFTARETPQQNGKVERAFATLYGRMRAMMAAAKWDDTMKHKFWMEAAATATKLDTIMNEKGQKSPYHQFYGEDPQFEKHLRTFGEVGVMTLKPGKTIKSKLGDRGIKCLFLGYAANHAGNVYRVLNLATNMVMISRDVKWLNTFNIHDGKNENVQNLDDEDDHLKNLPQTTFEPDADGGANENVEPQPVRLTRELRGLQGFNNPGRLEIEGQNNHLCFFVPENHVEDDTPTTFQEARYHNDPVEGEKWRQSIRLEFRQMIKNGGVWRNKGINSLPANRKGIGTKWVFKKKKNGVYRSRLVAKGYDQIAGVDFQYNFAPVTSEVTLRILLVMWIVLDLFAEVADVQTAFLHGDLDEEIFIKIPPGYKEFLSEINETIDEQFLKLEKSTYGLVQAARSWWKKFTTVLKKDLGFEQYENDSCLLKRRTSDGMVYLIVYVDDCFVLGDKVAVKQALAEIEKHFSITRSEHIEDFIGCRIEKESKTILLSQPDLIKKMLQKFGDKVETMREYDTPAPTGTHIIRCNDDEAKLSDEEQAEFRSGVGSLLYLLKHSRPDLSNSVRELSKVMDGANKAHQKALLRAIKFVEQTQERKLVLSPENDKLEWEIKAFSDSDFAGDSDTRKSVSGYIIYLNGAAISWRSKGQKSVSLSSTEAEYMAISEVAMEILYIVGILKFLDVKINYPIEVNVDNIGAVYLSKNATTGNRTKHIDTRYHFVREYVEDGIVKVVFVRSEDNDADIFTKNLNGETFEKHCISIGLKDTKGDTTPKMRNRKGVKMGDVVFPT